MMIINQLRKYEDDHTESRLYVPGIDRDMHALEDVGRPVGVKLKGKTCIPEGVYNVSVSRSARFGKDMLLLSNTEDGAVEKDGIRFTGIRPHGGNDVDDTEGCPLCNFNSDGKGTQWGRASDLIFQTVKQRINNGERVVWVISS